MPPVEDRLEASLATATWAMAHGAGMIRAHDVRATVRAATVVDRQNRK
jgi:dihydropteroate synthase